MWVCFASDGPSGAQLRMLSMLCVTGCCPCLCSTGYQFIYYSPENTAKAKDVLSSISQLQPLIATHADLLLTSASQRSPDSLKSSLKLLSEKVRSKSWLRWGEQNPHRVAFWQGITFHSIWKCKRDWVKSKLQSIATGSKWVGFFLFVRSKCIIPSSSRNWNVIAWYIVSHFHAILIPSFGLTKWSELDFKIIFL